MRGGVAGGLKKSRWENVEDLCGDVVDVWENFRIPTRFPDYVCYLDCMRPQMRKKCYLSPQLYNFLYDGTKDNPTFTTV